MKKYRLEYVQPGPASDKPGTVIYERKSKIFEADNLPAAQLLANKFLGGRKQFSLKPIIGTAPRGSKRN